MPWQARAENGSRGLCCHVGELAGRTAQWRANQGSRYLTVHLGSVDLIHLDKAAQLCQAPIAYQGLPVPSAVPGTELGLIQSSLDDHPAVLGSIRLLSGWQTHSGEISQEWKAFCFHRLFSRSPSMCLGQCLELLGKGILGRDRVGSGINRS